MTLALAMFAHLGCDTSAKQQPLRKNPYEELVLSLPPIANGDTALFLRLTVGPLHGGQTLVVRTSDDEILGSVSPFGSAARESGGTYEIPVPVAVIRGDTVVLRLQVVDDGHRMPPRPPTEAEFASAELARIPVQK